MRQLKTTLAVVGAAAILALAGNTVALAATGQNFLLGKTNFASTVTTVERTTSGPAFKITNDSPASAPFVTNGTGKVTNLNADTVDGLSSAAFQRSQVAWGYVSGAAVPVLDNGHNVSGVVWNDGQSRYEISITGQDVFYPNYVATISTICGNTPVSYGSVSGKLTVEFGAGVKCGFSFSVQRIG